MKSKRLVIDTEYDLHTKVVSFIRDKYPETLMIAGLGENQRSDMIRLTSWKKGYMAGQRDLMIMNPTSKFNSLCIEFKVALYSNPLYSVIKMHLNNLDFFNQRFQSSY